MMTMNLDDLLPNVVDGQLSEAEQLHLGALLRDDPAAQQKYLDYLMLDAQLLWEKPVARASATRETADRSRWFSMPAVRWGLAASVLLLLGVASFFWVLDGRIQARVEVVDQLADWNVAIADAQTPDERKQRFDERADIFSKDVRLVRWPAEDKQLAQSLFENARAMAQQDNPLDVAERLDGISEKVLDWMHESSNTANLTRVTAMERHYLRFTERSLEKLQRAADSGAPDEAKQRRMDKVTRHIAKRAESRVAGEAEKTRKKASR